ncbi:MAG: membrane protein insertase YidC [Tannerella sp.]|uniref:membrane protein insertase YidC n=1 Tax=Tannerella sp. TaxID=2382127 RepID=UPI003FA2F6EB
MSLDKNTIIGFILIGVVLFLFTWLNRPTQEAIEAQQHYRDSLALEQARIEALNRPAKETQLNAPVIPEGLSDSVRTELLRQNFSDFAVAAEGTEEFVTLENDKIEVKISSKGGKLSYARLKEYTTWDKQPLVLFDGADESDFGITMISANQRVVNTSDLYFTPIPSADGRSVVMRLAIDEGRYMDFIYTLEPDNYMLRYTIESAGLNGILAPSTHSLDFTWRQKTRKLEHGRKYEDQYTGLYYKYAADDVDKLSESKEDSKQIANRLKWIGYKNKYFATVLIADEAFTATTLESRLLTDTAHLKEFKTTTSVDFDLTARKSIGFRYFIGPNKYHLLSEYDDGVEKDHELSLDELVPMGYKWVRPINKYFVMPIFDFLSRYIANYGLIIFLLTLIVKFVLFPLTYKSYLSTAKMRVLRPQVEELKTKYPKKEQAMELQRATMELYNRAGASPMSGCLPMLLQLPILIALYGLFPTSIELRQQSFLWAKDLSTFDAVFSWNANIPLITSFMGNHISLFCLLMTIVQIIYSKINMNMSNTGQQQMPGMAMMTYMMPVMLFFMFNQASAGLSYYFLISTLITILQTISIRFMVNEEKLLAKLEENKKKPRKRAGWMERMAEMQRKQQAELERQQKQRAKQKQAQNYKRQERNR